MISITKKELKDLAWKIYRGWIIQTLPVNDLNEIKAGFDSMHEEVQEIGIDAMQKELLGGFKMAMPMTWFINNFRQTVMMANKNGISLDDLHEMTIISIIEFILIPIFGENESFVHHRLSDEQRKDIAFDFVMAMLEENVTPAFREKMKARESEAIKLARQNGYTEKGQIIEFIMKSNDDAMDFEEFFRGRHDGFIKAFTHGGIDDRRLMFEYYKLFLAHFFYLLGSGQR